MEHFLKPTSLERWLNKMVGVFARMGWGPAYLHLLEVKGRSTGKTYTTPVSTIEVSGRLYVVGGRGHTAWSKNALAAGTIKLRRGRHCRTFCASPVRNTDKPPILKAYLEAYAGTVQRFFTVRSGSPIDAFRTVAEEHPVFELTDTAANGSAVGCH